MRPFPAVRPGALLALALLAAVPSTAHAAFSDPVTVTSSGADPFSRVADIGFDRAGTTIEQTVSGGQVLVFTRAAGGSFSGGALGPGTKASMAVSAAGNAVLIARESGTTARVYYRAPGGSFVSATTYGGTSIGNVAAGIDSNGNAVVAWQDGGLHIALSSGSSFGGAQDVPLGGSAGFDGRGSDAQRDHGPRAYRDDDGNVMLVFRNGNDPTLAHRSPNGTWENTVLPGGASTDIQSSADPTSERLIVGYTTPQHFRAFAGTTTAITGTMVVDSAAGSDIFGVALQRGAGGVDLALWNAPGLGVRSVSCADQYAQQTVVGSAVGGGILPAVTSGGDEVAYLDLNGLTRASRPAGGSWTGSAYAPPSGNYGTMSAGAGYNGEAFGQYVDFPSDTGITGFPYTGAATGGPSCTSTSVDRRHPTAVAVSCSYVVLTAQDECTATVGDASTTETPTTPTGTVTFSSPDGGSFPLGTTCNLQVSQTSPTTSFCTADYIPASGGAFPTVSGSYSGDDTHQPSGGGTQYRQPTNVDCLAEDAAGAPCFGPYPGEPQPKICPAGTSAARCHDILIDTGDGSVHGDGSATIAIKCGGGTTRASLLGALVDGVLNSCEISGALQDGGDLDQEILDDLLPGVPDGSARDNALRSLDGIFTTLTKDQHDTNGLSAALARATDALNGVQVPKELQDLTDRLATLNQQLGATIKDWSDCMTGAINNLRTVGVTAASSDCGGDAAKKTSGIGALISSVTTTMSNTLLKQANLNAPDLQAALGDLLQQQAGLNTQLTNVLDALSAAQKDALNHIRVAREDRAGGILASAAAARRAKHHKVTKVARRLLRHMPLGTDFVVVRPGKRGKLKINAKQLLGPALRAHRGSAVVIVRLTVVHHGAAKTVTRRVRVKRR